EVATGRPLPWSQPAVCAQVVRFSPDGNTLFALEAPRKEGAPRLWHRWRVGTGKGLGQAILGQTADAWDPVIVSLSGDGKTLLVPAGRREGFTLWDVTQARAVGRLSVASYGGATFCLSHDGRMVAAADGNGRLCVYDA